MFPLWCTMSLGCHFPRWCTFSLVPSSSPISICVFLFTIFLHFRSPYHLLRSCHLPPTRESSPAPRCFARALPLWDKTRSFWDIKNSLSHERTDERVAHYLRLDSCLLQTTVQRWLGFPRSRLRQTLKRNWVTSRKRIPKKRERSSWTFLIRKTAKRGGDNS